MLKNQRGLTLIELLMALSLTGLIIMLAVQVYITQSSNFKVSQEQARLISEAQYIQERLVTIALQSQGIEEIWSESEDLLGVTSSNQDIKLLRFKTLDSIDRVFNYDETNRCLSLGTEILSNHVQSFQVKVLDNNTTTYQNAKSIEVELVLKSSSLKVPIEHSTTIIVTFRNK